MNDLVSLRLPRGRQKRRLLAQPPTRLATLRRGEDLLHVRAPEDVHHLLGGVGAGGVPLPAHDLALGGEAQLGGEVVLGLGGRGVHLVLLGLAVAENGDRQI